MKLVLTYGDFNPPTMSDGRLFQALADYTGVDTEVIVMTNDQFDKRHPMGVLERQEVIGCMLPRGVELRMDYHHAIVFVKENSERYESITYVGPANTPKSVEGALKKASKCPVSVVRVDTGDAEREWNGIFIALHGEDFDEFCKYYGGDVTTRVEFFNKLKDRVKCLN